MPFDGVRETPAHFTLAILQRPSLSLLQRRKKSSTLFPRRFTSRVVGTNGALSYCVDGAMERGQKVDTTMRINEDYDDDDCDDNEGDDHTFDTDYADDFGP